MILFLVFLPFLMVFWFAFAVLKFALRFTLALLVLPIVFFALFAAALAAGVALLLAVAIPLLPVVVICLGVWLIMRSSRAASAIPN